MKQVFRLRVATLSATCLLAAAPAYAVTLHMQGTIESVAVDKNSFTATGVNLHGNGPADGKAFAIRMNLDPTVVVVLDNQVSTREMALKPKRKFMSYGGGGPCRFLLVLSEATDRTWGEVRSIGPAPGTFVVTMKLTTVLLDIPFTTNSNTVFRSDGKALPPGTTLQVGQRVVVLPPRKTTVHVVTTKTLHGCVHGDVPGVSVGIVKTTDADGGKTVLNVAQDYKTSNPEETETKGTTDPISDPGLTDGTGGDALSLEDTKKDAPRDVPSKATIVLGGEGSLVGLPDDVQCFLDTYPCDPSTKALVPGAQVVYMQIYKRGRQKLERFLAATSSDEGLTTGMIRTFDAVSRKLVVAVRTPAGLKDTTIELPADVTVQCDGKEAPAADALAPGRFVNVFSGRPLTVEISTR